MTRPKALVTGAAGFLGAALVDRLLVDGSADVRCAVRAQSNRRRLEAVIARHPGARVEVQLGSLASPESAARLLAGIDVVYHLAAGVSGAPADMFLNTVVASKNLLEAAIRREGGPPRFVLVSSFSVYGVADQPRGVVLDEKTPLETQPMRRDPYAQVKLRQEQLFWEYARAHRLSLVVLRPGVIYGPGGGAMSSRVGLNLPGLFLYLGGRNVLPLTYVDNCAEAVALAGRTRDADGQVFNVIDDELLTCRQWLARYRREVRPLRVVPVAYPITQLLAAGIERYSKWSKGQLPPFLTPYKVASSWKGNRFDNRKLKSIGWQPLVPTAEGVRRTFEWLQRPAA